MHITSLQKIKSHLPRILGALALILFITIGLTLYFQLERFMSASRMDTLESTRTLAVAAIIGYGLIMLALQWGTSRIALKPNRTVLDSGRKIASRDMGILTNAITELSQGNLSKQLNIKNNSLEPSPRKNLNAIIDIFNAMGQNLNDASHAFNNITGTPCKRLFYVGADSFLEGRHCGKMMGECLKGKGQVVIAGETFTNMNLDLRRRGFLNALQEDYPNVEIIETLEATAADEIAYKEALKTIKTHPNMSAFYVASGSSPGQFAQAVVDSGKKGQIRIICHDLIDATMQYLKEGVITATLSQNAPAQGHDPVIHMYNHLSSGWKPLMPYLLTEMAEVNMQNYQSFWRFGQGEILSAEMRKKLAKPVSRTADKPLRIAVLGRDDNPFWKTIKRGVAEARTTLLGCPVTVDWIVPEKIYQVHKMSAEVYGPAIEEIIADKYDGLVTVASDHQFIPYINRAVETGIPVGLYNSDPTSLRGLIFTISSQAHHLLDVSANLATSTTQTSDATLQIMHAMDTVARSTRMQNEEVTKTSEALENLLEAIHLVKEDTEKSAQAAEDTMQAVQSGAEAMKNTLSTMLAIEQSVSGTWGIVEELGRHSDRIDKVVDLINDIARRVNILALNAAIEATKAGEYGSGFMIVANEIRTLSRSTTEATHEVAELIGSVQRDISKVDKVMSEGLSKLTQTSELTDGAMTALGEIQKRIEIDKERIQSIASAMTEMQNTSMNVGQAMLRVGHESEQNSSAVEQVNTLTRDMTKQLEAVTNLAKSLELMARGEQQMLAKFSLAETN